MLFRSDWLRLSTLLSALFELSFFEFVNCFADEYSLAVGPLLVDWAEVAVAFCVFDAVVSAVMFVVGFAKTTAGTPITSATANATCVRFMVEILQRLTEGRAQQANPKLSTQEGSRPQKVDATR